jgi:chromosome segregation ATPase
MSQEKELPCQCPDGCKVHEVQEQYEDDDLFNQYISKKLANDKKARDNLARRINRATKRTLDKRLAKLTEDKPKPEPLLYKLPESVRAEALENKLREIGKENEQLRNKLNDKEKDYQNLIQQLMDIKALIKLKDKDLHIVEVFIIIYQKQCRQENLRANAKSTDRICTVRSTVIITAFL